MNIQFRAIVSQLIFPFSAQDISKIGYNPLYFG